MLIKIIEKRLQHYQPKTQRDELNALKEIIQEVVLCGLSKADFFNHAAFQGGSCLRIIHNLNRFSEDLDFILCEPNKSFVWQPFLQALHQEFLLYGLEVEVIDRSKVDKVIKQAFLKDSSFGKVLLLSHPRSSEDKQKIKIKLEIDTNPPAGSTFTTHFLNFPYSFALQAQDLPSLFASKCHALLCRSYAKGRDWYDFCWYVSHKVIPNFVHLAKACEQAGPWSSQSVPSSPQWLITQLNDKASSIDWEQAKNDITNFLTPHEREHLNVWGNEFFLATINKLANYL